MSSETTNIWHALAVDQALGQLEVTVEDGLTTGEASKRQQQFGANVLTKGEGESALKLFLSQFKDPMIYTLIGALILVIILGDWLEAVVISIIVLANAIIGFYQESKALQAMDALS